MPDWSGNELTLPEVAAPLRGEPATGLAATLLYHPDPARLGEMARFPAIGTPWVEPLSRLEPLFAPPGGCSPTPLSDPYLSRSPLEIMARDSGLRLRAPDGRGSWHCDGRPLRGEVPISWERVRKGLVLSVAHRVVLLLHPVPVDVEESAAGVSLPGLVGECAALRRLRGLVPRVAATETPVLLLGETGTGKEQVARAIHEASSWASKPLVSVNMAALPAERPRPAMPRSSAATRFSSTSTVGFMIRE